MKLSSDRILTTHVGSLPRPEGVSEFLLQKENDETYDHAGFDSCMAEAVRSVVGRQVDAGIDIVSDGEMSKTGYAKLKTLAEGAEIASKRLW
jgi:5-methyltetrahydropteroyltriglutamate--homocysteine methyltransferase